MGASKILVVEDDESVARDLRERVIRFGYEVVGVVPNAERAVAAVFELRPDVVLMDMRLRGDMDGVDAAIAIHRTSDVPIVFMSAGPENDHTTPARALADEPAGYLVKPVNVNELEVALSGAIRRARRTEHFRKSEKWLGSVLNGISDAVIATVEGEIRCLNPAAERLTGWTMEQAVGVDIAQVLHTKGEVARDARLAPTPQPTHETLIARDGTEHAIELRFTTPLEDSSGEGAVWVFRDITERQRTEDALRQSEERFRLLVDAVKDWEICMLDVEGRVVSWNAGAERLLGYRADEIVGRSAAVFGPQGEEQISARALETAVSQGRCEGEGWCLRKDGSRFWANDVVTPIRDAEGKLRGFAKVVRDVTESRRAEEALRASEERFRFAVELAELGTWDAPPPRYIAQADDRCKALFGLLPEDELSLDVFYSALHPDDLQRTKEAVERAITYRSGSGGEYNTEYRAIGVRDRVERWIDALGKVFFDEAGNPKRFLGVVRDITERHRIDEVRDRLTGIFAHDLRSPLSAILTGSEVLLRQGEESTKIAHIIRRSAERMASMIEQLMDFTRVRFRGEMPVQRDRVDLAALCRDAVVEAEAANPGREVKAEVPRECLGMWDRIGLSRVLSNLLGNALQHGCPNSPVSFALRDEGATVILEVRNQGVPIPEETLPLLFDPFRRGRSGKGAVTERGAGLGLGLYITREIVRTHGGDIDVRSAAEEGSTFTVRLPRA